jgi:proline iminopeptidase
MAESDSSAKQRDGSFRRFVRIALATLAVVLAALAVTAGFTAITWTPHIRSRNGIAERKVFEINGWKEWTLIRGRDRVNNPLLIVLHGGPGMPMNGYLRLNNAALENHYTVVYWEQRGAGYSWDPRLRPEDMTVAAFVSDLRELIGKVKAEIGGDPPVYLMAFSWGTVVGLKFIQEYPEMIDLYIGVGQVTDDARAETVSRDFALKKAREEGNQKAIGELQAIGLPPYDYNKLLVKSAWAEHYGAYSPHSNQSSVMEYIRMLKATEYAWPYLIRLSKGAYFSIEALQYEIAHTNFFKEIPEVRAPVVFLEGRCDYAVPREVAEEYFKVLKAPGKRLIIFENSGHSPQKDEPDEFNRIVISLKK